MPNWQENLRLDLFTQKGVPCAIKHEKMKECVLGIFH
jgi:hypothetical protein